MTIDEFEREAVDLKRENDGIEAVYKRDRQQVRSAMLKLASAATGKRCRLKPGATVWQDMCPKTWPIGEADPGTVFEIMAEVGWENTLRVTLSGPGFGDPKDYGSGVVFGVKTGDLLEVEG